MLGLPLGTLHLRGPQLLLGLVELFFQRRALCRGLLQRCLRLAERFDLCFESLLRSRGRSQCLASRIEFLLHAGEFATRGFKRLGSLFVLSLPLGALGLGRLE